LEWSPDGSFLLTPSACYYDLQAEKRSSNYVYTVYGFLKHELGQPAFMLPGIKSYATAIRFNPFLYAKSQSSETPEAMSSKVPELLDLPYKMIFAVATTDQVVVYATNSIVPLAVIGNIHYAPINDMAWHGY